MSDRPTPRTCQTCEADGGGAMECMVCSGCDKWQESHTVKVSRLERELAESQAREAALRTALVEARRAIIQAGYSGCAMVENVDAALAATPAQPAKRMMVCPKHGTKGCPHPDKRVIYHCQGPHVEVSSCGFDGIGCPACVPVEGETK